MRLSLAAATDHPRDDFRIDCAAAVGDADRGLNELLDRPDALLEQVPDAVGAIGEQLHGVALVVVLREDEHCGLGPALTATSSAARGRRRRGRAAC